MAELALPITLDFEEHELKKNYQKFLTTALIIAALIHFSLVGLYWASVYFSKEEPPARVVKIMKYSELGPPPSITGSSAAVAPSVSVAGPNVKPSIGIPVPVPDAEVSAEQTFATQQELSQVGPVTDASASGGMQQVIEQDVQIEEDDVPPPSFVPFEKEPVVIKKVDPIYPELAKKAGMEGTVYANLWVDKQGKVREVKIVKAESEIFVQPVIDAAKLWLFSPAMMKNGPVAVWVAVPFRFSLKTTR